MFFLLATIATILALVLWFKWGLQMLPGAFHVPCYPIVGNSLLLMANPAQVLASWAAKYRSDTFVIHLGKLPVLVANSYADVSSLWLHHAIATNSRPLLYTFHNIVSAQQGLTVGSTPAGASCLRKKKCVSQHLSKKKISSQPVVDLVDRQSKLMVKHLLQQVLSCRVRTRLSDVDLLQNAQFFVLSCALFFTYGTNIDCYGRDYELATEIIETENKIIRLRSPISNYQDYLPFLRNLPFRLLFDSSPQHWRDRRDAYMQTLFDNFNAKVRINDINASSSMLGQILAVKAGPHTLSARELQSVCLTMVSAGLDNTSLNFEHLMGHFSHPYGYAMQEHLFLCLMADNGNSLIAAWRNVAQNTDCVYAKALVHETLRYFSVLPLSLPRLSTKALSYKGMSIPAETTMFMNAYAANHDDKVFQHPNRFDPMRWIEDGRLISASKLKHFAFGAGSRQCSGNYLAIKELHTLVCRMVLVFRIRRPTDSKFQMKLDPFAGNLCPSATSFEPKPIKVWLEPRQGSGLAQLHQLILR